MKKKLLIGLAVLVVFGIVYAGTSKIQIVDQTLDGTTTSITGIRNVSDYDKIAFFVDYDETDTDTVVSVAVTVDISHDGTNWIDADFSDFGGAGETSETLSVDGYWYCWLDDNMQLPYVRLSISATGTTDTLLADIDAYLVGEH